ncbi:MAG: Acyl-coenzyme A synthetase [Candidatus Roizmanbacteria bacterium GW2011_GWC2_35_12]|uniref:acetate--CoA ligase n=1 Tax=Candidatus Roizmanbacteria bacterium GW2011_GWC2_35_12 TaxID=1618485 RepID=A0A0G0DRR5_9BACT|nr:MAG: Acyl-coenzyme A synthetase [Candidatus Roizmanbacteria bacterium GW2011_GWC2_35_12]
MLINPKPETLENSYTKDYEKLYRESIEHPEAYWENIARELSWFKPWNKVLDWKYPYARWFVGGETNIVYNALDRWQKTDVAEKLALIWVAQDGTDRKYTYKQLNDEVCKFANGMRSLGVKKGDKVTIYLPRIPEQFIAMLSCLKIGAVHSVVYSGFSADALKNRIEDADSKIIICADGYPYGKKFIETKKTVDLVVSSLPRVEKVIVIKHGKNDVEMKENRDIWWHELVAHQDTLCSTQIMESNDPSFVLYTSGTTGKPKGIIHGHGGYMVGIYATLKYVFDIKGTTVDNRELKVEVEDRKLKIENQSSNLNPQPLSSTIDPLSSNQSDIFWSTADAGWITGHSYILYGPLINGITTFVYEGTPDFPDIEIWWRLIDKYKVTKFYTAPTAIRALMKFGEDHLKKYDLSTLKILGSVGEPINPEAWMWFYKHVGREKLPIMDTWWQTETGMHMITPVPSVGLKPGSAFKPFFGVEADVVDDHGKKVPPDTQGYLIIKKPWPSMFLDVYNNPTRYKETYFEKIKMQKDGVEAGQENSEKKTEINPISNFQPPNPFPNPSSNFQDFIYFAGDSAKIDADGYFWIVGRNDRLGSAELESAFVSNTKVAEAAVIGKPHEIKGESIKAFVILKQGVEPTEELKKELVMTVRKLIGPIATPDEIDFVDKLPKTRSGKIMRRVLKAQELGQPVGDISTLED